MKIIVTGANGLVGTALRKYLGIKSFIKITLLLFFTSYLYENIK